MNAVKMTALVVSLIMISGLLSSCARTNMRSEEQPFGQSYVRETPEEQQSRTYREEVKRTPTGEVERVKEEVKETGEKTSRDLNQYNQPRSESYSKEEIHREHKPEHGRT